MQIKKFKANNMTDALTLIKREFGSDAVILSAKTLNCDKSILGAFKKNTVEVTAATDSNFILKNKNDLNSKKANTDYKNIDAKNVSTNNPSAFITSFNRKIKTEKSKINDDSYCNDKNYSLVEKLIKNSVAQDLAQNLVNEFNNYMSSSMVSQKDDHSDCFSHILDEKKLFSGPLEIDKKNQKVVCLTGLSGVGKTSTIVKLAAYHLLKKKNKVAVITLDNFRIGSASQLSIFSKIVGFPYGIASNVSEVNFLMKQYNDMDLIFIDTPGISLVDKLRFNDMKNIIHQINVDDVFLVLSSNTQVYDLNAVVDKFNDIPINRLIFTKIDESLSHGNILSLLLQKNIPVAYFTNGQNAFGDIEIANSKRLMNLIFPKDDFFDLLDQNRMCKNDSNSINFFLKKKLASL